MNGNNGSNLVQLPPALLLECKLTWKKFGFFVAYCNLLALFLFILGFGPGLADSLAFCNCAAWPGFFYILAMNSLPKPATVFAMVVRIGVVLLLSSVTGAVLFAIFTGVDLAALIGNRSDIAVRTLALNLFCGSSVVFFFKTNQTILEAKRLIMEEKIRNLDMKNMSVEMELKVLQAQIEPHFLFNTLSNVMSLIDTRPEKAKAMLGHFCDFLRGSLHIARNSAVPISQEMALIRNYLEIQKMRMGDRLNYVIDMPDSLMNLKIPPLLIQPLVENSVRHGLDPLLDGGEISIRGELISGTVRITVSDSGKGISESATGNGVGLENIRRRIRMSCHTSGNLILEENLPSGVRATIEMAR